ncbi:MAG TPA: serine protein kinase RIO [Thermoplasmatales archaeon]|nr:serine protein kinase RIO [Thermoplasmatales archaeon]
MQIDEETLKRLDRELQAINNRIGADRKTLDEVFDRSTLLTFGKLISDRIIEYVDFPICTGKEANIFRAITPQKKFVAVKVYRTSTSNFNRMIHYIQGDPRFPPISKNRREIIYQWVKKELANLEKLAEIGVPAPKPIKALNNILVMDYIGGVQKPAPLLKDVTMKNPDKFYNTIIKYIETMYIKGGFVHSDLSEYNILVHRNKPVLIDLAQGVVRDHPLAMDFLQRDIRNIVNFFRKHGVVDNEKKVFNRIISQG